MSAGEILGNLTFTSSTAAAGVEGPYDPEAKNLLTGFISLGFNCSTVEGGQETLRATEARIAAEVRRRLETFDSLVAEREELRRELASSGMLRTNGQ